MSFGPLSTGARIFWISFILLFGEIMAVRWLGIEIFAIRAFPNLIIMAVLVASSAGLASAGRKEFSSKSVPLIVAAVLALVMPVIFAVNLNFQTLSLKLDRTPTDFALALGVISLVIVCIYFLFTHLGRALGREFDKLPPLEAYSINLLGSVAGVLSFALISFFSVPPFIWVIMLGLACAYAFASRVAVGLTLALALCTFAMTHTSYWSPYSKLDVVPIATDQQKFFGEGNYVLNSNNHYFHFATRVLEPDKEKELAELTNPSAQQKILKEYYRWLKIPFETCPRHDSVLVLGAGSGNDVAFALKSGAKSVHAVEIDPIICTFGSKLHPNKPYLDPRVHLHNEDARSFLRYSKEKFDLIEFAYLDPGSTLNSGSFLRVDNYVYTKEAMESALRHLNENGVVCLTFATGAQSAVTHRLYKTVEQAWGQKPICYVDKDWDSVMFLFGPGSASINLPDQYLGLRKFPSTPDELKDTAPSTDNWPFLYLQIESAAIFLYIGVLLMAVIFPGILLALAGRSKGGPISGMEWGNMFFLGQAFMLVETKSITELSLLFGATWFVSSIVILVVLLLAYIATVLVSRFPQKNVHLLYGLLVVAVTIQYLFNIPADTDMSPALVATISALINCLPIFFGSMIFSTCFSKAKSPANYLSANLLGVSIGGLVENLCVVMGLKNLTLVAGALYGLSYLCALGMFGRGGSAHAHAETDADADSDSYFDKQKSSDVDLDEGK